MTQEKHTPGPCATKPVGDYQSVYDAGNTFFEIARVRGFSNHDAEANARLIAAAPDALEALEYAHEILGRIYDGEKVSHDEIGSALQPCQNAIDKAKGE